MRLTNLLVVVCLTLLIAFYAPWMWGNGKEASKGSACLSIVKRQTIALNVYASEHEGRYPLRDAWMDATRPYSAGTTSSSGPPERCPALPPGSYGYAFNARLSAARAPARPETIPLVYDSVNPLRNASDRVASLPAKGRHDGKNGIAYADGHARRVTP